MERLSPLETSAISKRFANFKKNKGAAEMPPFIYGSNLLLANQKAERFLVRVPPLALRKS
jgi:hypothetical protein